MTKKKKEVVTRTYRLEENVLALILGVQILLERQQPALPLEYRKAGYEFLKKIQKMAGIEEDGYLDYDIVKYDYNVTFEKNPYVESD